MNLRNMGRTGLLPLLLGVMACSDMDSGEDTFRIVYPNLVSDGGSGGNGQTGNAGSSGAGGTDTIPPDGLLETEDWSCLKDDPRTSVVPRGTPTRIQYRVPVVDFDTLTPVPGIIVEPCTTSNCDVYPSCAAGATPAPAEPCAIVTPPASAASPIFVIDFPYNFTGGLKITKPGEYAEMDYFFGGPLVGLPELALSEGGNVVIGQGIPVLKSRTRERAYQEVGVSTVDPTRGTLAVRTLSCRRTPAMPSATGMTPPPQGQRAAGVSLEAMPAAPEGSAAWALSTGNVFSPNRLITDARGVAGFLNAPPVITDVQAVLPDGTTYGYTPIRVRADVITLAELRPGLDVWGQ